MLKKIGQAVRKWQLATIMADDHYREYVGKKFVAVSILLTLIFWAAFTYMLVPFVPAQTAAVAYAGAAFTALCLAGVFYLATHMFRVVLAEHRKARRAGN